MKITETLDASGLFSDKIHGGLTGFFVWLAKGHNRQLSGMKLNPGEGIFVVIL